MDLEKLILADRSKPKIIQIVKMIGNDLKRFAQLWKILMTGEKPLPQRAAWILEYCIIAHPDLLTPYYKDAITLLKNRNLHNAIHRSVSKSLSNTIIPEEYHGELFSICMDLLLSPNTKIAIKAHCMEVAFQIATPYEELQEELSLVIKELLPNGSAGIRSRGNRILKDLKKLRNDE